MSNEIAKTIDEKAKQIFQSGYEQTLAILKDNQELLDKISQHRLKTQVIEGKEL